MKKKISIEANQAKILLEQVHELLQENDSWNNEQQQLYKIVEEIALLKNKRSAEDVFDEKMEEMANAIAKFDFSKRLPISDSKTESQLDYIAACLNRINEQLEASAIPANIIDSLVPTNTALIITNSEGYIRFANTYMEKLGLKRDELKGKHIYSLLKEGEKIQEQLNKKRKIEELPINLLSELNDDAIPTFLSVFVAKNRFEETEGMLFTFKNENSDEALLKLGRVAHDLISPSVSMSSIIKFLKENNEVAKKNNQSSEEYITMLQECNERNITYAQTVLRKLHGIDNIQIEQIYFNDLINETIKLLRYMEGANDVHIKLQNRTKIPFYSDKDIIRSILQNLISNAIKYRKKNQINQLLISITNTNTGIELIVKDSGIGMNENQQNQLFNKGFRVSKNIQGNGFGMYSVQEYVYKLKGNIEVKSELGIGTTFKIHFPTQTTICNN